MLTMLPTTDTTLVKRLEELARQGVSKAELAIQRISFVYGNLPQGSTISREKVEQRIKEHAGE